MVQYLDSKILKLIIKKQEIKAGYKACFFYAYKFVFIDRINNNLIHNNSIWVNSTSSLS